MPAELAQALALSRTERRPLLECERRMTGATHAEIGAYLLGLWGLPYPIVEAVALHHAPTTVTRHGYDLVGALAVSHSLLEPAHAHALIASSPRTPPFPRSRQLTPLILSSLGRSFRLGRSPRRVAKSALPAD